MREMQPGQEANYSRSSLEMDNLKETTIPWLGRIPADWTVSKVKWQFDVQLGKMLDEDTITGEQLAPYLRNKDVQWWDIHTEDLPEMDFSPAEKRKYNLQSGDVLVCEGGEIGRSAVWTSDNIECYYQKAIHRVRPTSDNQDPRFFCYFMEFAAEDGLFVANTNRSTIDHLTAIKLKNQEIPVPPSEEQEQIVDFLDSRTTHIDALVEKQKRLLDLLDEKRQTVITQAVTKGQNTTIATKSTDAEWLGEIPKGWGVSPLKYQVSINSGTTPTKSEARFWDGQVPWFTAKDMKSERLTSSEDSVTTEAVVEGQISELPAETVLIVTRGMILSHSFPVGLTERSGTINQDMKALIPTGEFIPEFLQRLLQGASPAILELVGESSHGTKRLDTDQLKEFRVPVPPIDAQERILNDLTSQLEHIDMLTEDVNGLIDLLKEKRQALITAAVTGQIDVTEEHGEIQDSLV